MVYTITFLFQILMSARSRTAIAITPVTTHRGVMNAAVTKDMSSSTTHTCVKVSPIYIIHNTYLCEGKPHLYNP